nr:MAG TPA: hypothetical protein [Caudoviricetes sp.]
MKYLSKKVYNKIFNSFPSVAMSHSLKHGSQPYWGAIFKKKQ